MQKYGTLMCGEVMKSGFVLQKSGLFHFFCLCPVNNTQKRTERIDDNTFCSCVF